MSINHRSKSAIVQISFRYDQVAILNAIILTH